MRVERPMIAMSFMEGLKDLEAYQGSAISEEIIKYWADSYKILFIIKSIKTGETSDAAELSARNRFFKPCSDINDIDRFRKVTCHKGDLNHHFL